MNWRFWKPKKRVIRIPIKPGHEDTEIRFVHEGGDVSIMRLANFNMNYNRPSTAEFVDLSYFAEMRMEDWG